MAVTFVFQGHRRNVRYFREYTKEKIQVTSCYWERRKDVFSAWDKHLSSAQSCEFASLLSSSVEINASVALSQIQGSHRLQWAFTYNLSGGLGGKGGVVKVGASSLHVFCRQEGPNFLRF